MKHNLKEYVLYLLMKIGENNVIESIGLDKGGAYYQEYFNHPYYLNASREVQVEMELKWAEELYRQDIGCLGEDVLKSPFFESLKGCDKILDIGCYIGGKSIRSLELLEGKQIYGVDIDEKFLEVARRFAKRKDVQAFFLRSYAEDLLFPNDSFDLIISDSTFEHVRSVKKALKECRRVLKSHGYLIVNFPSFYGPSAHHLGLVTRTPCIHWFFKPKEILKNYDYIINQRGSKANWYRRKYTGPLLYKKGLFVNGVTHKEVLESIKYDWKLCLERVQASQNKYILRRCLINYGFRYLYWFPMFKELFPINLVLQKI